MTASHHRYKFFALLGVLGVAALVFVVAASYTQLFKPVVSVTAFADRSGLLLDPRADVSLRGMTVGKVRDVRPVEGKAEVDIALEPEYAGKIPDNVTARITSPSAFGAKYVDLQAPGKTSEATLADGDVIQAPEVATESETLFENLMGVLTEVPARKLNSTLGAVSTTLQGRGEQLGNTVSNLNSYLEGINPTLPAIEQDLHTLSPVLDTYSDAAPDLLRTMSNVSTTSKTIADKENGLNTLLRSFDRTVNDGRTFLDQNGQPLQQALSVLRPTTEMLGYYSPEFPCLLDTTEKLRQREEPITGGDYNGVHVYPYFTPGNPPYQKGKDDPVVGVDGPPRCYPIVEDPPHHDFNDGTTTVDFDRTSVKPVSPKGLAEQLLGPAIRQYVGGGK